MHKQEYSVVLWKVMDENLNLRAWRGPEKQTASFSRGWRPQLEAAVSRGAIDTPHAWL